MDQSFLLLEDAVFNSLSAESTINETMYTNGTDYCDDSGFETTTYSTISDTTSTGFQNVYSQNGFGFGFQPNIDQNSTVQSYFPSVTTDTVTQFDFRPHFVPKQEEKKEKLELCIASQPTRNHRARYKTEGSRGAIKDRSGRGFPVIKLKGYNKSPVKLRCYIGHDDKVGEPHLFYQASKIIGKHLTPSQVKKIEGIKVVEMELLPENGMQAVVNCIGVVKERNFDVQRKATVLRKKHLFLNEKNNLLEKKSSSCRMVFCCFIPDTGKTLQVVSDPITCTQVLGSPEIHKMSRVRSFAHGGDDLFVIGRNFAKDLKVIFEYESSWREIVEPEVDYVTQNHFICKVPAFTLPMFQETQTKVSMRVKCGDKFSDSVSFLYLKNRNNYNFNAF